MSELSVEALKLLEEIANQEIANKARYVPVLGCEPTLVLQLLRAKALFLAGIVGDHGSPTAKGLSLLPEATQSMYVLSGVYRRYRSAEHYLYSMDETD